MTKGEAPIGYDLEKVILHHVKGMANNMAEIVETEQMRTGLFMEHLNTKILLIYG